MPLISFTSNTSLYIVSIVSVTSLCSSQYKGNFLRDMGPMPKREELLKNSEAFPWHTGILVNVSMALIHHALFPLLFILINQTKISRTFLYLSKLIPELNYLAIII